MRSYRQRRPKLLAALAMAGAATLSVGSAGCTQQGVTLAAGQNSSEIPGTKGARTVDPHSDAGADLGAVVPVASKEFITESAQRTSTYDTGRMDLTVSLEGSGVLDGDLMRTEQQYDKKAQRTRTTLTFEGLVGAVAGIDPIEMITDGTTAYLKNAQYQAQLGVNTPWVKYTDPCGEQTVTGSVSIAGGSTDAKGLLDALKQTGAEVTEVAKEKLDGRAVRHYSAEVDFTKINPPNDDATCARQQAKSNEAFASSTVPVDVWIDEKDGVVLREDLSFDMTEAAKKSGKPGSISGTMKFRMEFSGFGDPVSLDLPAESKTTPVTKSAVEDAGTAIGQSASSGGLGGGINGGLGGG